MSQQLSIQKINSSFADRYKPVPVFRVTDQPLNFGAFLYQCTLNLDIDGAPKTYGYNNPASTNTLGQPNLQTNLTPLESWKTGQPGIPLSTSQKVGLGNACGDPGDSSKGWNNFLLGNRNFYWAGLKALTRDQASRLGKIIDDRPELEAGLAQRAPTPPKGQSIQLLPIGQGYFPVVQDANGTAPGYYISTTSTYTDPTLYSQYDPHFYLNAETVPYAVWANEWSNHKIANKTVRQGDVGIAICLDNGAATHFVFGDAGTPKKVGESSLKLHKSLGSPGSAQVLFIAFPGSGEGKQIGVNPEILLPIRTGTQMMRLGANAFELATTIALGLGKPVNKKQVELTGPQAAIQAKLLTVFKKWTTP